MITIWFRFYKEENFDSNVLSADPVANFLRHSGGSFHHPLSSEVLHCHCELCQHYFLIWGKHSPVNCVNPHISSEVSCQHFYLQRIVSTLFSPKVVRTNTLSMYFGGQRLEPNPISEIYKYQNVRTLYEYFLLNI